MTRERGRASLASQQPSPVAAKHLEMEFAANLAYLLLASSTMPLDGKVWMCRYASAVTIDVFFHGALRSFLLKHK